jgi:hypothetical protein
MKRNLIMLNATDVYDNFRILRSSDYNKIYKDEHRMKGALSC